MTTRSNIPLFLRRCSVEINSTKIEQLRITFDVSKDIEHEPNRAHVKIFNLSENSRNQLQANKTLQLRLIAGYEDVTDTLFLGDVTHIISGREGADWVTSLNAGDGVKHRKTQRVAISTKSAGGIKGVIQSLLAASGLGQGNLDAALATAAAAGNLPPDVKKAALHGNLAEMLDKYSKDAGLEHSSQDGVPTFVSRGNVSGTDAVILSPDTGLIGSPELSKKGLVKAQALIQRGFNLGSGIILDAKYVKGLFQVHKVKYTGDTHGSPWYADLELLTVQ